MLSKQNWYQKHLIEQNASLKENAAYALLVLSILGFDAKFVHYYLNRDKSNKDIPAAVVVQEIQDPSTVERAKQILIEKEKDPVARSVYQKAKEDAERVRSEVLQKEQQSGAKQPIAKEPLKKKFNDVVVDDALVQAVKAIEGSGSSAVSHAGASGVMQVMRPAWEEINKEKFGGKYPYDQYRFNERINMAVGKAYLEKLARQINKHKSKWENKSDPRMLLMAAYNAGLGNVKKCNFDIAVIKEKMPRVYDYALRGTNIISKGL